MSALACGQKLTRFGDTSTLANMALVIPACVVPFRDDPFIEVWLTPGKSARLDPGSVKELALRKTDEASTRIENHKMLGSADKDAVKHQGWKQTVFTHSGMLVARLSGVTNRKLVMAYLPIRSS